MDFLRDVTCITRIMRFIACGVGELGRGMREFVGGLRCDRWLWTRLGDFVQLFMETGGWSHEGKLDRRRDGGVLPVPYRVCIDSKQAVKKGGGGGYSGEDRLDKKGLRDEYDGKMADSLRVTYKVLLRCSIRTFEPASHTVFSNNYAAALSFLLFLFFLLVLPFLYALVWYRLFTSLAYRILDSCWVLFPRLFQRLV